jgi:hypothetical protein
LGITLGTYVDGHFVGCTAPDAALKKLDPLWGQYFWYFDLQPRSHVMSPTMKAMAKLSRLRRIKRILRGTAPVIEAAIDFSRDKDFDYRRDVAWVLAIAEQVLENEVGHERLNAIGDR